MRDASRLHQERSAFALAQEAEATLAATTALCDKANLPFDRILVFAFAEGGGDVWVYWQGEWDYFYLWDRSLSLWQAEQRDRLWAYFDSGYRCREIVDTPRHSTFALLWLDSVDSGQELIGMPLPWIVLGYWRRRDNYDILQGGAFYRLWLTSEKIHEEK